MHVDLETTKGLGLRIRGCIIICTKVNEFKLSTLRYFKLKNFGLCQKMICKIICNMPKARTGVLKLWWIMEFSIGKSQKIEPIFQFMKKNCQRNLKFWTLLTSTVLKQKISKLSTHSILPLRQGVCRNAVHTYLVFTYAVHAQWN